MEQQVSTHDLPGPVQRAYLELGAEEPAVYRSEAEARFAAAMQASRDGDLAHAILMAGLAQGFLTLALRLTEPD